MDFGLNLALELWQRHLIIGIALLFFIAFTGIILIRSGRSPLWCLLMLIPGAQIIALWVFAFIKWPTIDQKNVKTDV